MSDEKYTGPERRSNAMSNAISDHWHLDKKVPVSIIVALLLQAAAGLWAIADMKKDIEILKVQTNEQHDKDAKQDIRFTEALNQMISRMDRVEAKLDRLVERK